MIKIPLKDVFVCRAPEKQRYSSPLRLAKTSKLNDTQVSGQLVCNYMNDIGG